MAHDDSVFFMNYYKYMSYDFPFGDTAKPLVQEHRTPKKVFVLGVYENAVHAYWMNGVSMK